MRFSDDSGRVVHGPLGVRDVVALRAADAAFDVLADPAKRAAIADGCRDLAGHVRNDARRVASTATAAATHPLALLGLGLVGLAGVAALASRKDRR